MAARQAVRLPRAAVAIIAGGGLALYPRRTVYAEAPPQPDVRAKKISEEVCSDVSQLPPKKPIYSDFPIAPTKPKPSSTSPVSVPNTTSPTPTDRLTGQVKNARLFLYDQSLAAEKSLNSFMSWAFAQETSFTNTIASLAPAPETGEQLLPGVIYVLVATMAGSIVSRNRGILLRATVPLAVGITAGWMLIPVTMQNIADLSWEYEKKVPMISETHAQISGFTKDAWRQTKVHANMVGKWADDTASESRRKVEGWVEKGR